MKTIGIFTTTRGDIAALIPLIHEIQKSKKLKYKFFVGGTHLNKNFGKTINEIKKMNKIKIASTFKYKISSDKKKDLARSLNSANILISRIFEKNKMDLVCLLGDRFEKLSIVNNAIINNIPIFHICGGEKSEGAIDEIIRHIFTKSAHLHFAMAQKYKNNILKMGEESKRVFNVGHLAIDNIKKTRFENKKNFKKIVVCTFHPETQNIDNKNIQSIKNIITALKKFNLRCIFTMPGYDHGSKLITQKLKKLIKNDDRFIFEKSLGYKRLFDLYKHAHFVIGNSSSGITEAPYFKIPTINVGERQKGRMFHQSVINCNYSVIEIQNSIKKALDKRFKKKIKKMKFYFGNGNTAKKIVKILENIRINKKFLQKKLVT